MKLNNIKLTVETDGQNQYALQQHIKLNKECAWGVSLDNGYDYWFSQTYDYGRAVCSVWKGFRNLVIDSDGDLIICAFEEHYNDREEKEITFTEFKAMCEPKKTLWDKRLCIMHSGDYTQKDVKEALKELLNTWKHDGTQNILYKKAKEIFGDELL